MSKYRYDEPSLISTFPISLDCLFRCAWWRDRLRVFIRSENGMSTAEYAIGTIAAAAFAAVLYAVVTGDSIVSGLTSLVEQALSVQF